MAFVGCFILGGGFLFFSQVDSLWQFYLAFMIMSLGVELGTWLAVMTALNNWFVKQRATAMAGAMEGFALGGVILVPLLAWSVDPDDFGLDRWRAIAAGIGVFTMIVAFPCAMLVRDRPPRSGRNPERPSTRGTPASLETAPAAEGQSPDYTLRQGMRTRNFWLITLGHGSGSAVIGTFLVHLGPLFDDRGFSLQMVGWVISVYTGVSAVFILVGGYVGDRVPIRVAVFAFSLVQAICVVVAIVAHNVPMAFLFGVLMGIGFGGRVPLTTAIRGVYFGRRSFAVITGTSQMLTTGLSVGAPMFAGIMFDITGKYDVPLIALAIVSLVGAVAFLFLREPRPLSASRPPTMGEAAR